MPETRCRVCGRGYSRGATTAEHDEYSIIFSESVCELCGLTLARAFAGIVEMLRQSHGERRERVLDRLIVQLEAQGFATDTFPHRRRSA
jgi:hypothetical protein